MSCRLDEPPILGTNGVEPITWDLWDLCPNLLDQVPLRLRISGLEPLISAWKADVLPLYYTRIGERRIWTSNGINPCDLQSHALTILPSHLGVWHVY